MSKVQDRPLSIPKFTLRTVVLTISLLAAFRFIWPSVWESEVSMGSRLWLVIPLVLFVQLVALAEFEWFFHRYVLHNFGLLVMIFNRPGLRWLFRKVISFRASHEAHHHRTPITARKIEPAPNRIILNDYAMIREEQFESSAFPPWSVLAFWAYFIPAFIVLHLLLPRWPGLICGIITVALVYWLYEVIHSIHHYSFTWWEGRIAHRWFGGYFRRRYAFHQFHHHRKETNEGVMAAVIFEWPDKWKRTYHYPPNLLLQNQIVTADEIAVHQPIWLIRKLDALDKHFAEKYVAEQRQLVR